MGKNTNPKAPKCSGVTLLEVRAAAHDIVARTGVDVRTALRALHLGPDAIRTLRLRETLRPLAEEHRARLGLADGR